MNATPPYLKGWKISTSECHGETSAYWASVFTLGNGLLGLRGTREEAIAGSPGIPMTLMAEVYDRPARAPGEPRKFRRPSRLVNLPNSLCVTVRTGNTPIVDSSLSPERESWTLDMKGGTLTRDALFKNTSGQLTRVQSIRLVSQARPNIVALRYSITPLNYSASLTVESRLDSRPGYPDLIPQTRVTGSGARNETLWLGVRSLQSKIDITVASRHSLLAGKRLLPMEWHPAKQSEGVGLMATFHASKGTTYILDKISSIHNGLHEDHPLPAALSELGYCPSFSNLTREHAACWTAYWRDSEIHIKGDLLAQTMARFFVFQLLQSASDHNATLGLSASIPAKGLSGPGYNGHVFWDTEIYMLPFFSQQYPHIAESLLRYRYDRLPAAIRHSHQSGTAGTRFPWESADTGLEECPKWLPRADGYLRWKGGEQEIHISADVAMGYYQHIQATGNKKLLHGQALEIAVGTARYWASVARQDGSDPTGAYHIRNVIGPDEYHSGINDSVYTNAMAAWNLRWATELIDQCRQEQPTVYRRFMRTHRIRMEEVRHWLEIADKMTILFNPNTGLYEEFDGYFKHPRQQIKQADVMLMLHLLPSLSSSSILLKNFNRYFPVTLHDSSLSPALHVLFSLDCKRPEKAYPYMRMTCEIDGVRRGNSTDEGLHYASFGAGWLAIVAGFGGVRVQPNHLAVTPLLPPHWQSLAFSTCYQGLRIHFRITPRTLTIRTGQGNHSLPLRVAGKRILLKPGATLRRTGNWRMPPPSPRPPPSGQFHAVLFDLDGVIVSTDEYHYQAWKQLADAEGIPFDRQTNHLLRGVSRMQSLDIVLRCAPRTYSPSSRHALAESKNAAYCEQLKKLSARDILPGVMLLIDQLKERGLAIAVASSSKNARFILDRIGLGKTFDTVVDGNDIKFSKPDPEVFLLASKRLGIPPHQCWVIEDAAAGVQAANAAGMHCLAVGAAKGHPAANLTATDLMNVEDIIRGICHGA